MFRRIVLALTLAIVLPMAHAATPVVGSTAPDFTLKTVDGKPVSLKSKTSHGTVALVFLRGFPGYQCPFCVKQVHDFIANADKFAAAKIDVLLVYPGPSADLDQHAREALAKQADLPANIQLVTDPDYTAVNLYGIRWDAPHETAHPSTFMVKKGGQITFVKVSEGHGDRTTAEDILKQAK